MEWFTYIVYGLAPIIIFSVIGFVIINIIMKLLIDSWSNTRRKIATAKELQLMQDDMSRGRRF